MAGDVHERSSGSLSAHARVQSPPNCVKDVAVLMLHNHPAGVSIGPPDPVVGQDSAQLGMKTPAEKPRVQHRGR